MKSMEDRLEEIRNDPVKLKRAFTVIWVAAYGMLVLGAFIIVAVLVMDLM